MYLQNFLPSSTWTTGGSDPHCSGGRTWVKRRNVIIPKAHACSKLQHKNKSFTEAEYERDFEPLGTEAAPLDIRDLFLALESPVALGDSFECVLKGVAPADSELTCSTEQCCTEYLWHWNSCEFFCHHRCLEWSLHCCECICSTSAVYMQLYSTSCLGGLLPTLFNIKAQTRYKYLLMLIWHKVWCIIMPRGYSKF